ncbi:MAG: hypothetical protein ACOX52_05185 [Verrucomicrobiota bacterium]|jgi:hypothetical protein
MLQSRFSGWTRLVSLGLAFVLCAYVTVPVRAKMAEVHVDGGNSGNYSQVRIGVSFPLGESEAPSRQASLADRLSQANMGGKRQSKYFWIGVTTLAVAGIVIAAIALTDDDDDGGSPPPKKDDTNGTNGTDGTDGTDGTGTDGTGTDGTGTDGTGTDGTGTDGTGTDGTGTDGTGTDGTGTDGTGTGTDTTAGLS